jgi:hypothetical protein
MAPYPPTTQPRATPHASSSMAPSSLSATSARPWSTQCPRSVDALAWRITSEDILENRVDGQATSRLATTSCRGSANAEQARQATPWTSMTPSLRLEQEPPRAPRSPSRYPPTMINARQTTKRQPWRPQAQPARSLRIASNKTEESRGLLNSS